MKKKKIAFIVLIIIAIVLELLPYGAVLRFASPEESSGAIRQTYSYFSLTPYGYANFGPFLTALLTCVLLVLAVVYMVKPKRGLQIVLRVISALAVITSVMPLLFGLDFYSVVGAMITAVLLIVFLLSLL